MPNKIAARRDLGNFFEELPFQIVALTLGFQNLIRRLRKEVGLTENVALGMGGICFALLEQDGCRMTDLGERLGMPKGTLSGLIERMEQQGLVTRKECTEDGRAKRVFLTAKARRREPALRQRHHRALEVLQAGLSSAEVNQLQSLLGKVLNNLGGEDQAETHGRTSARAARR